MSEAETERAATRDDNAAELSPDEARKVIVGSWRSVRAVPSDHELLPKDTRDMRIDSAKEPMVKGTWEL